VIPNGKAALPGGQNGKQSLNTFTCNSANATRQPHQPRYSPPLRDPLKQAAIANGSLKINLRRLRRDLVGAHKIATVDRLLDVNAAVSRSLEWLNGKAEAVPHDFEALDQLAIESGAVPDAVEVLAQ
jgi:hypothetical protein